MPGRAPARGAYTVGDGPDAPTANPTDDTITTVVQPDISVFCRYEILDEAGAGQESEVITSFVPGGPGIPVDLFL